MEERLRRGWDLVAAARVDPELPEADWLQRGIRAAPQFWYDAVRLDVRRLRSSGGDVGLSGIRRLAAAPLMIGLRLVDLVGIVAALRRRPVPGT